MRISNVTRLFCWASYEAAEATSVLGWPGEARCVICGALLDRWQEPKLKAFRLVIAAQHRYPTVSVPPSFRRNEIWRKAKRQMQLAAKNKSLEVKPRLGRPLGSPNDPRWLWPSAGRRRPAGFQLECEAGRRKG
jgi:hypothetical protein